MCIFLKLNKIIIIIIKLLLLIFSDEGVKSGLHWLRATTSCLGKPRFSVLYFNFAPWTIHLQHIITIIIIIIIVIIITTISIRKYAFALHC